MSTVNITISDQNGSEIRKVTLESTALILRGGDEELQILERDYPLPFGWYYRKVVYKLNGMNF